MFIIKCTECNTKQILKLVADFDGLGIFKTKDISISPFAGGELKITCNNCGHELEEGEKVEEPEEPLVEIETRNGRRVEKGTKAKEWTKSPLDEQYKHEVLGVWITPTVHQITNQKQLDEVVEHFKKIADQQYRRSGKRE